MSRLLTEEWLSTSTPLNRNLTAVDRAVKATAAICAIDAAVDPPASLPRSIEVLVIANPIPNGLVHLTSYALARPITPPE